MSRTILATFPSITRASDAVDKLKGAGYGNVQIDRVSEYPSPPGDAANSELNNPIAGQADSLTGLSVYSADHHMGADARPLVAADPSVSGLARGDDLVWGHNVLVTVVTKDKRVDDAVKIIKEHGGEV